MVRRCKPSNSNSNWVVEMEEGLKDFMRHKSTAQAEGKKSSDNSKTCHAIQVRMVTG